MKYSLFPLILITSAMYGAESSGPLQVGGFTDYVSQTATKKIVHYLQKATTKNGGTLPTGSVTEIWSDVSAIGVNPYFATHHKQLQASASYISKANNNSVVQNAYDNFQNVDAPLARAILWGLFTNATNASCAEQKKATIPDLNLEQPSVVDIMLLNQTLLFTTAEKISFGGAVAAEISIMQLLHNSDLGLFKRVYRKYLPGSPTIIQMPK